MNKVKKNELGFGAIGIVLIVVVIGVVSTAAWLVYKRSRPITPVTTPISSTTTAKPKTTAVDPTASWTAYSDPAGKFALRYPTTWVTATHPDLCSPGIFLLGPTATTVGKCGSEDFGQVHIVSSDGDSRSDNDLNSNYTSTTKTDVTVDGVAGKKITGTATSVSADEISGMGGLEAGTIVVKYVFYTGGKTYVAGYTQTPSDPDVLADFNLLVTKTLTFI